MISLRRFFLICLAVLLTACAPATKDELGDGEQTQQQQQADIYLQLGIAYMREGRPDVALPNLKKAVDIAPDYGDAHNGLAVLYESLGENELAAEHYRRAVRLKPKDPYIRNAYGSFLCSAGQFDSAREQFEQALKNPLYKTPEVALTNAGICARRAGDPEQAEKDFRRALEKNSRFPQALAEMAAVSLKKERYMSARAYLQRYREVAAHTANTLWLGVQTERALGDRDAVASYSLQLKSNYPDAIETMRLMESQGQESN